MFVRFYLDCICCVWAPTKVWIVSTFKPKICGQLYLRIISILISQMVTDEISRLVDGQKTLENKYASALNRKHGLRMSKGPMKDMLEADRGIQSAGYALKASTAMFARGMKQSPLTEDNLQKIQNDRGYLEQVMSSTLAELDQGGSFDFLLRAVNAEKQKKAQLQDMILK